MLFADDTALVAHDA